MARIESGGSLRPDKATATPTIDLRYVENASHVGKPVRLQQRWCWLLYNKWGHPVAQDYEWRDVPTVNE